MSRSQSRRCNDPGSHEETDPIRMAGAGGTGRKQMGGRVGMSDVGTSPDDNVHNGFPTFVDSYRLGRSVLAMGT